MNKPLTPDGISEADRLVDLMRLEGVSAAGVESISEIRQVTMSVLDTTRGIIADGRTVDGMFFFLMYDDNGQMQTGMLPCARFSDKDAIGNSIRKIASRFPTVAVIHTNEGWSLWGQITKADVDEIQDKYGGRISKHPRACDVVFVHVTYNVLGKCHFMHKMFRIDESQTPRKIVDETPWVMHGGTDTEMQGRMIVPHTMLKEIK